MIRSSFARRPSMLRGSLLSLALLGLGACASLRPMRGPDAIAIAKRSVCGAPGTVPDSACVARSAVSTRGGYRVIVDRRPPAGNDRVAVDVRRGGDGIEVTPIDTSGAPRP